MASASGVKAGRAYVEITLNSASLQKGLKKAQEELRSFGSSVTSVGKQMLMFSGAMAAPFALATKSFANFDDAMRMVKAVSGATNDEFKMLTDTAEKLGRETSYTAKEVADAMAALGRMGFTANEINNSIPAVLSLARATGTELAVAAEIASNNMRVFGIEASKMSGVADIMTATANGSAQTLTDLGEALKMAGPQAAAAGDTIENVSGALGVLANMGIKGSLAGTALRKSYSQFAKTKVQDALSGIGIATTDANGNLREMPAIMADIAKYMNKLPTAKRLAFAEDIFDLRGSLAGLQLGGNIQQLEDFIEHLKNVRGEADRVAKEQDSGIGGSFRILTSAVEGCQIAIGRIISDALKPFIEKASTALNRTAEWIAANKEFVIGAAKVIAGIAGIGAALVAIGVTIKALAVGFGVLSAALAAMKIAITAPIILVHALTGAYALLAGAMVAVKTTAIAMWAAIVSPIGGVIAAVLAVCSAILYFSGSWESVKNAVVDTVDDFGGAFSEIGDIAMETFSVIKDAFMSGDLAGAAKVALSALKVVWLTGLAPLKKAWAGLKQFLADAWTVTVYSILRGGNNLWYGLLYGLKSIGNAMRTAWDVVWGGIVDSFWKVILEIRKAWIKTKGIFTSDEEVEAEIAAVERVYREEKNAREQNRQNTKAQNQKELAAINAEWDRKNQGARDAESNEILAHQKEFDDAVTGAADEISKAKTEWQNAVNEVKKTAAETAKKTKEARDKTTEAAQNAVAASVDMDAFLTPQKHAVGGFSADVVSGMIGGSVYERTANATERTADNTEKANRLLKSQNNKIYYG